MKKSRKSMRRMKFRGGMNDLGEIFMKLVENQKKLDAEEEKQEDAQSEYRQVVDEEREELRAELSEKVKDEEKTNQILGFVRECIQKESSMKEEIKNNRSSGSDAQGDSRDTMEYYGFLSMLEDDYGINTDPTPSTPKKRPREESDGNEEPYKHVFSIGETVKQNEME
jgi:hypothetical protein